MQMICNLGVIALKEFKSWIYFSLMDLTYNECYMFKHKSKAYSDRVIWSICAILCAFVQGACSVKVKINDFLPDKQSLDPESVFWDPEKGKTQIKLKPTYIQCKLSLLNTHFIVSCNSSLQTRESELYAI